MVNIFHSKLAEKILNRSEHKCHEMKVMKMLRYENNKFSIYMLLFEFAYFFCFCLNYSDQ